MPPGPRISCFGFGRNTRGRVNFSKYPCAPGSWTCPTSPWLAPDRRPSGSSPLDVCFPDHRCQRLLGHPPGFQEAGEIGALPELRDLQFDRPGPGLPDPIAVAVAVVDALRRALAMAGAGQALDLHRALSGKADHHE